MKFPLSFWDFSLWIAGTAIILLFISELLSFYGGTNIYVDKKRLEIVSLTLGITFMFTVVLGFFEMIL